MTRVDATTRAESPSGGLAIRAAIGAVAAVVVGFVVWFVGFDIPWAMAVVLVVVPVGALLATRHFADDAPWDPPPREMPRGSRLTVTMLERSIAACDRLARPPVVRRMRGLVISERDDRLARLTVVRQLRALITAELQVRGVDPTNVTDDAASSEIVALLGPDALMILQPHTDAPIDTAAMARCLDAIERLGTATQEAR